MEMLIAMEFFLFFIVAGLFILWIWALVDIIKSKFQEDLMQIVWLLIVFFLPFLGVLLYLLIGRSMKQSIQQKDNDPTLRYTHLEKLKTLLDSGVISETEFEAEKEKILNS
ncbi:SHOCT domain-containing protein [Sulfuricurvum sp.]|uniref:SHOCT domain-containing protein n=1 Tax=Sulfuricurvum sp. TaxID=2025608 RepID=UPI003565BFB5